MKGHDNLAPLARKEFDRSRGKVVPRRVHSLHLELVMVNQPAAVLHGYNNLHGFAASHGRQGGKFDGKADKL